ncbi:YbjN domain-containing protein [Corynebacterium liangguodongii]|uniref:Uncharacterized protein n=1 Tax=Corynebacterium liangguodongii TaxID=2079535 RepID=A0A2S0WEA0_9CORY|nr:YbjN domain-containing protein [Corynebacterium liangguodongii]AWB84089.1 hypothetical protein C3E79_06025 [Corynebacterium liangguodongii]PWC00100.1 hypothetical protein DF219_02665 [Corynebacterium liangguodongii]
MDFPRVTQEVVVGALSNLGVEAGVDEEGVLGAEFPAAVAQFYVDENFLTIHTTWNRSIAPAHQEEALEIINMLNRQIPTGKVAPIVVEGAPTIDVREHFLTAHGASEHQLCMMLDAYFQIAFMVFDDFEQRGFAQNAQV